MWREAIDNEAALDILLPPFTEEGWGFPERTPSSHYLSLVIWDRVLSVVACVDALIIDLNTRPDVLVGWLYTFALSIADVIGSVVPDLAVTLCTFVECRR